MGAKKKGKGKKGKGKKDEEEDLTVEHFWKYYRKKIVELQCESSKILKKKYEEY